jgi:hypothetical protein
VQIEFRAEDPEVPIKPEHKMAVKQVRKEIEPHGFDFKEVLDSSPDRTSSSSSSRRPTRNRPGADKR